MKLKKILAAVAAAAVAVSTMAVSAFAIKDYPDGYVLDLIAEGYDVTSVAGFTIKISGDIDSGVGGGVGFNSATTGWDSTEWGNDDANKAIKASNGEVTIKRDAPVFKESDVTDPTNPYAQIWMQQLWGSDVTIDAVIVLDKDGNELTAAKAAPVAEEAPAAVEATELWSGSNDLGTDWSGDKALKLDASLFANVADGSTVEIEYTTGDADYYNLKIVENTDGWPALSSPTDLDPQYQTVSVEKDSTSYSFTVNADDAAKLQANGMVIQGYAVTLTKVAVNGAAAAPAAEEKTAEAAPEAEEAEDEDVDVDVEPEEEEEEPVAVAETEAPAVEEAPAPAVENATAAPATGNTTVAAIAAVMAVAGVAAIAAKKRK